MKIKVFLIVLTMFLFLNGCSEATSLVNNTEGASASTQNSTNDDLSKAEANTVSEESQPRNSDNLDFSFISEDIYGNPVSSDIYGENKLTLVNIFATWCPPCVEELPYLSKLRNEYKDEGLEIIGFITDTRNYEDLSVEEEAIESSKKLYESSNGSYPYVIPDESFLHGLLFVQYVPTSVFLDKDGNMVGEPVVGGHSYEDWEKIIKERLSAL